jgi:type III secretory pathway component EscU
MKMSKKESKQELKDTVLGDSELKSDSHQKQIDELAALVKQHSETLENFRTSFRNIENLYAQLKERNRLR